MYIKINKGFWYDEEFFIEAGVYKFITEGINFMPMIKVNGEWFDLFDMSCIDFEVF